MTRTKRSKKTIHKQRSAWASGHSLDIPVKLSAFEVECAKLGIDPENMEALVDSKKLQAWVLKHKDNSYVPSLLLHKLKMVTVWQSRRELRSERHLPRFSAIDARLELPVYEV